MEIYRRKLTPFRHSFFTYSSSCSIMRKFSNTLVLLSLSFVTKSFWLLIKSEILPQNAPNVYLVIVNNIPLPFFFFKHINKQNLSNFYTISGRIILDSSKLIERPNASGLNTSVLRLWKSPSWSVSSFLPFTVPICFDVLSPCDLSFIGRNGNLQ